MPHRKVEKVQISQLIYSNATVFYAENPDEYYVLPEYFTTTERRGHERVWVVYYQEKNPYVKPIPEPIIPYGSGLSGLINSLPSDYF